MKSSVLSRSSIDKLLALGGIILVLVLIYRFDYSPLQTLFVAIGTMMIYVGGWRQTGQLLNRRANRILRKEIDDFTRLVRKLYSGRTNGDSAAIHETKAQLRESFERILAAAANYQEQP